MTPELFKADKETLQALLQKESARYEEALRKDIPFKFMKAIRRRIKCLSCLIIRKQK